MAGATWDSKATSTSRDLLRILKSLWPDIEVTEVTEETARQGGLCDVFCSSWYLHAPTYNVNLFLDRREDTAHREVEEAKALAFRC